MDPQYCPAGLKYSDRIDSCKQLTCKAITESGSETSSNAYCESTVVSGCECEDEGFFYQDGACVPKEHCKCVRNGVTHHPEETWTEDGILE